jgi:hypothetical protein
VRPPRSPARLALHDTLLQRFFLSGRLRWDTAAKKSMADNVTVKIFTSATNPGEAGRRKTIVTQAAKAFGAVRVDPRLEQNRTPAARSARVVLRAKDTRPRNCHLYSLVAHRLAR